MGQARQLLKDCKKAAKSFFVLRTYSHFQLLAQFVVTIHQKSDTHKLIIKFFYGLGFRG